ncbi:hypothetical protein FHU28_002384 [Micromonospora echinospora]|uniref:Uncharacterized protein n=1 Tax=Micromonospora echinospora TaxID=1877 RepID=A0ABR6MAZ7_MICEC|nr:hypothetical protein [Micromonospora echinospora]MBB5112545.1 hypothetical protein [Micromonospora echinospora]
MSAPMVTQVVLVEQAQRFLDLPAPQYTGLPGRGEGRSAVAAFCKVEYLG